MNKVSQFKVKVRGRELGKAIGTELSTQINASIERYEVFHNFLLPFYSSERGRKIYDELLEINRKKYPEYIDEIAGTAEGCGRKFHELMLLNLRTEMGYFAGREEDVSGGCFEAAVLKTNKLIIGHNEDGHVMAEDNSYLLTLEGQWGKDWTAFCYPGQLPGVAFGSNRHGIVYTVDSVSPTRMTVGLGRQFIARDILEADSLDAAVKAVTVEDRASGSNFNIASIRERKLVSVETSSSNYVIKEIKGTYLHSNHYIYLSEEQTMKISSTRRLMRAKNMPEPTGREEIINILADTEDKEYPIYRNAAPPDKCVTLVTVIFDLDKKISTIYTGHPKFNPGEKIHMSLI